MATTTRTIQGGIDMSRQTVTIVKCDLCGKEENVRHLKYPVLFTTDQTEGRGCTPYISHKELDLCDECIDKVIKITGWGAQGYNHYSIKGE